MDEPRPNRVPISLTDQEFADLQVDRKTYPMSAYAREMYLLGVKTSKQAKGAEGSR